MINITAPKVNNLKAIKTIRRWVEDGLPPEREDVTVMVNELQCYQPGCAPVETVVSLLDPMKPIMFKVFMPIRELASSQTGAEQVVTALKNALGGAAPQHKNEVKNESEGSMET